MAEVALKLKFLESEHAGYHSVDLKDIDDDEK